MKLFSEYKKAGRKYYPDLMTYRCKKCKINRDVKLAGTNICPRCNVTMGFKQEWSQIYKNVFTGEIKP